uniref:Uncharacterized protein n=1 Tax=viral metagenome TaxID=1070528 RepID=A0A6C0HJ43_9ZZZZ
MTGFYQYCILLFRRIFGVKKTEEESSETWDASSDTMRIGSELTIGSDWSRDSENSLL